VRDAAVARHGERIVVSCGTGAERQEVCGSHLLAAVGRLPNSDDLGLQAADIATDAREFLAVDAQLRTKVPGVWAVGDANGRGGLTHTAYNDFELVAGNLLDGELRSMEDRIPAYALFIDPPLGRVGMSEAQVRATGRPALVGVMPMSRVGRAKERGETQGFMKVLVDAQTECIRAASLLCIEGDEIVHSLLDVGAAGASYRVVQRAVHIHPTRRGST
jgi:pyruvate/2-oxoglutarate dehydrogenase complex dihydrolipoamide dehydrogenase (E3) component